jgi:hypothetical protein
VAEWEKDKADAHDRHEGHEVKAAAQVSPVSGAPGGHTPFPGQAQSGLPPVPKGLVPGSIFAAHRIDDMLRDFAHANERLRIAKKGGKATRGYHMIHVNNHLSHALDAAHAWSASLRVNFPAEARELDALTQTIGLAKAVSDDAKVATYAHLLQTILYHAAHAKRHALLMTGPSPDAVWKFNWDHAATHSEGAIEHCFKLAKHLTDNYPETAAWFEELEHAEDPADPYTGLAVATAPGARPFLLPAPAGGKYTQYGLYQNPVQSISPSPPLPPLVALPTAAEVRAVIPLVPDCTKADLSDTARKFLEQAAWKLEKGNPIEALGVMRSAEAAMFAAHKADLGDMLPSAYTANVFTRIPAGEQSSATTAMKQGLDKTMAWRKAQQQIHALSDRIRKRYFHGVFSGPSQMARLTEDDDMTALDRVLALAGAAITTGKDVSFPTESDTSAAVPLIEPPEDLLNIADEDASRQLAALPALDKARVNAYLAKAREMMATSPFGASTYALRAAMIAKESGAHDLARHIRRHVQALGDMGNATHQASVVGRMQAGARTVSAQDRRQTTADTGNRTGLTAVERVELAAAGLSDWPGTRSRLGGRMSLDKVLQLTGAAPPPPDPDDGLLLAAQLAARELTVLLAGDDDGDDKGGKDDDGDGDGGSHSGHPTYKALVKKKVPPDRAASMCAKSDKNVKAAQLAAALDVILSGRPGLDIGLVTLTPGSEDAKRLHSAAVLAAFRHGDWKAAQRQLRGKARELGVDLSSLPGFGQSEEDGEKAAESMLALAAKAMGDGGVAMNHAPFTGTHSHSHFQSTAHAHPHQHVNDSTHDGGPLHRPGSSPKRAW